jgi:ABC-type branched-subunit amino acid transport system ATPase component
VNDQRFVIIEGPNGVGKSTIRPLVSQGLGQMGDHVIDRLVASYYVFDRILRPSGFTWGIGKWLHELEHLDKLYQVFHVTLVGTPAEILQRLSLRGSTTWTLQTIEEQARLFDEFHKAVKKQTTIPAAEMGAFDHAGPRQSSDYIVEWINEHPRRSR